MKVSTDIRKSTPVMAVVGVTDLATHALRTAQADLTARAAKAQDKAVAGVETLRAEAEQDLAPYRDRLPGDAWQRSIDVTITRLLRDRYGLPTIEP